MGVRDHGSCDAVIRATDIRLQRRLDVGGIVLNPQNTPIGAEIEVSGIVPGVSAQPAMVIIARRPSDPGTGRWRFTNALYAGSSPQPFKLAAYSPFFPRPALFEGQFTSSGPDLSNVALKFESIADNTGRLGITVVDDSNQAIGEGFPSGSTISATTRFALKLRGRAETIRLPPGVTPSRRACENPMPDRWGRCEGRGLPARRTRSSSSFWVWHARDQVEFSRDDPPQARGSVQVAGFPRWATI
jgi:hypothetical protein